MKLAAVVLVLALPAAAFAQSPELSLREFASGQIKKGVRSIGFGGDGATWGNYSLVWRDAGTALVDGGVTAYENGNVFGFTAVGATTPALWRGLAVYAIALSQSAQGILARLSSPGLGPVPVDTRGDGGNQALFVKVAMPLPHGFAVGLLLSYEVSQFTAVATQDTVRYQTRWRPSGGFGASWQPNERMLLGIRVILNHDWERRLDRFGVSEGLARSYEFRAGFSASPWQGALFDVGGTILDRANGIAGTERVGGGANLGFEQAFWKRAFVLRAGVDECQFGFGDCTVTAGFSVKRAPVNLDVAYLYDLGKERIGTLFGEHSHSVLATLTLDYLHLLRAIRR
ncbi:MAG: hypothetical protein ACXVDD_17475 [Polyangia bacterium]